MTAAAKVSARRKFRAEGEGYVTTARGVEVLDTPLLNKATAFKGLARTAVTDAVQQVQDAMWQPEYRPVKAG